MLKPGDLVRYVAADGHAYIGVIKAMWDEDHAIIGLHHYALADLELIDDE